MVENKEKIITALLTSPNIKTAAKKAKLSERTIYRAFEDKEFITEYRAAKRSIYEASLGQIQSSVGEAIATLSTALTSENDSVKVRAAQIILDYSAKTYEQTEITERVEALEAAQEYLNGKK